MIIPTLCNNSFLYKVAKYRDHWQLQLEKRKAYRLTIAIFVAIAVIVMAWIVRP